MHIYEALYDIYAYLGGCIYIYVNAAIDSARSLSTFRLLDLNSALAFGTNSFRHFHDTLFPVVALAPSFIQAFKPTLSRLPAHYHQSS